MRFLQIISAAALVLCCALAPARAEKRVALVVGNAAYQHADKLANPVNDARGMRDVLKKLGFDVAYGEDLDLKGLHRAIGRFADRVADADVAIVYFAGHGATFGDVSYVVPVDAEFASLGQVSHELVSVETLIGDLRQVKAKGVRIAVLDACRDNERERDLKRRALVRGGGEIMRGLAPIKNPSGLIIAYATQYMSTAVDDAEDASPGALSALVSWTGSTARHSPFTAALLNNIATPGVDVRDMFFDVGRDVVVATGGRQHPEISVNMFDRYALVPGPTTPAAAVPEPERVWRLIHDTTSTAVLEDYLRQFGDEPIYGALARERREKLAADTDGRHGHGSQPAPAQPPAGGQQLAVVAPPVAPEVAAQSPCRGDAVTSASFSFLCVLTAEQERRLKPRDSFRECENCPDMVVVPPGSFTMGSPEDQTDRWRDEGPQHTVTIARAFAVSRSHITRAEFAEFVHARGYERPGLCDWRNPGFAQQGSHPVVCVSWDDARAYAAWLANKTGKRYRLLSEAEFEYAARGQTTPGNYARFWFGNVEKDSCRYANSYRSDCDDGFAYTSPGGQYAPNPFGLFDMAGNAWQWTADCYHENYNDAPADGSAWTTNCSGSEHVVRGGSWLVLPRLLRAAHRYRYGDEFTSVGFRVARTL